MAKNIVQYDLLISCPGDIQDELQIIREVVDTFNEQFSDVLGLSVRTKHWSKNSYPESGGKPQNLLNNQLVKDCDAAVAIFWTRFGTPTDEYGSGTEEEIEQMLEAEKQVFMYFSEKAQTPSIVSKYYEDYLKIQALKDKYKDRGIYWTYTSNDDFRKSFFAHLSQYFLSLKRVQEISQQKQSKISVKSIGDKDFSDVIIPVPFILSSYLSSDDMLNSIKNQFSRVWECNILHDKPFEQFEAFLYESSPIEDIVRETIVIAAINLNLNISDDFFALGGLRKKRAALPFDESASLEGNDKEKTKYYAIRELYEQIDNLLKWTPFEEQFKDYACIKLVAVNEGNTYDEDIEISLKFSKKMIICLEDLPIADEATLQYVTDNCSLYDVFGIQETTQYNSYESSKKPNYVQPSPSYRSPLFHTRDYTKEYLDELDSLFEYKTFQEGEDIILKLHIDYLKHKTAVAFPTVIFITNEITDVHYSITSKHSDKVVSGVLRAADISR